MIDDEERKMANEINTKIYNAYKSVADKTVWKEEEPQNISPVGEAYIKMQEKKKEDK